MSTWQDASREQIRLVQDGLLATAKWANTPNTDPKLIEMLMRPYRALLEELYEHELPLAKLADESDLLIHVKGPAASGPTPRVSVLTKLLTGTRDQVTRLAKQIGGVFDTRVPPSLDMGFVGVARGSLFVGFSAGDTAGNDTQRAVDMIGQASELIARDASLDEVAEIFEDPAERDLALAAIRHLAPSGQMGITELDLLGRRFKRAVQLTTDTRRHARTLMAQPAKVVKRKNVEFIGTVRELDLDAQRFEIRNIDGYPDTFVRCAHELDDTEARDLLNRRVRVRGIAEVSASGRIGMLWVDELELLLV